MTAQLSAKLGRAKISYSAQALEILTEQNPSHQILQRTLTRLGLQRERGENFLPQVLYDLRMLQRTGHQIKLESGPCPLLKCMTRF